MVQQALMPPPVDDSVSTVPIEPLQILTLNGVTWDQYITICDALPDHPGLRTAFDGNTYELMVTSTPHEKYKSFLGRMFEMLAFELEIKTRSGGTSTFRREDLEKGLEADECYWIAHEEQMRRVAQWQPDHDPPPDLAIEVDVSTSSVKRHQIYAALGVRELWRFKAGELQAFELSDTGDYEPITESIAVPGLVVSELARFLMQLNDGSEDTILRSFVEWVRENLK